MKIKRWESITTNNMVSSVSKAREKRSNNLDRSKNHEISLGSAQYSGYIDGKSNLFILLLLIILVIMI